MENTGLLDKNSDMIKVGHRTKLTLPNGDERVFEVKKGTVNREVVNHPTFSDKTSRVAITGYYFEWNGFQLFPCINEKGFTDTSNMEIVCKVDECCKNRYYWSFEEDKESWSDFGESVEECIKEARSTVDKVTVGQKYVFIASNNNFTPYVNGDTIAEDIVEQANSECGDVSEGWLDHSAYGFDDLSDRLTRTLNEWLEETGQEATFGTLDNIKKYNIKTGKIVI